jgi:hypothetical protein
MKLQFTFVKMIFCLLSFTFVLTTEGQSQDKTVKNWHDIARNISPEISTTDDKNLIAIHSDHLGMLLEKVVAEKNHGIRLVALVDIPSLTLLTPPEPQSLFTINLRQEKEDKSGFTLLPLVSDHGWNAIDVTSNNGETLLTFRGISNIPGGEQVCLTLLIQSRQTTDTEKIEITKTETAWYERSSISVIFSENIRLPDNLTLESATLMPIRLTAFGSEMKGFYPRASGIVVDRLFAQDVHREYRYPGAHSTMSWFAVWNDSKEKSKRIGFYVAAHDVDAAFKQQIFHVDAKSSTVSISSIYHAENCGRANSRFTPCKMVLESYRGDWFDAAVMYRDWVRREASWYPRTKINSEGRIDTPLWMKELAAWILYVPSRYPASKIPEIFQKFQTPLNVPVGIHWYEWSQIPHDNDYPHFFPTKNGFKSAVAEIQKDGNFFVMPYINGRMWDQRDRKNEDWLFTKEALPGVAKKEDGSCWSERWGKNEVDGGKNEFGTMCPTSDIWNNKMRELIFRLSSPQDGKAGDDGNLGVKAVYVDQIAGDSPVLCYDSSHRHPLGGGTWWVAAQRKIFEKIKSELPNETALTAECNAEPYINIFDGYLTWHFQYNNQVPAFAAVYGGAVQMIGRNYGAGPDHVIACKMRLAESFVFGEQLGWCSPLIADEPEKFDYLKKVVALRYKFREYFYKGEMARPPKLYGNMPRITADWRFYSDSIVTANVIQTGAWRIPAQKSAILLFANSSKHEVVNRLEVDLEELGFNPAKITVVRYNPDGTEIKLPKLPESLQFNAEEVFVLEIKFSSNQ